MNTVIYSENLATRADTTTSQPIVHANSMETGTEEVIRYINEHNTSPSMTGYSPLRVDLEESFENISDVSGRHSLRGGQVTHDILGPQFNGTWIRQTEMNRNFTDVNFARSWTLVTGANGVRGLRINVNSASVTSGSSAFKIEAQGSSGTWRMHVGSDKINGTDSKGNDFACPTNSIAFPYWINVSKGNVAGTNCTNLHYGEKLDPIDNISYTNSGNVTGSYRMIVNTSSIKTSYGSSPSEPYLEKGIYGTWIEIDFERDDLVFRTDRRVVPGEDDD
jgi:hypothetical protein